MGPGSGSAFADGVELGCSQEGGSSSEGSWCPYEKATDTGTRGRRGRGVCVRRGCHRRTGEMRSQAKECRERPDARRGRKGALCGLQRDCGPTQISISDFRPPELGDQTLLLVQAPSLRCPVTAALGNSCSDSERTEGHSAAPRTGRCCGLLTGSSEC